MTQPECNEGRWPLVAAIDLALRQLEAALPDGVKLIVEVHHPSQELPLQLEYSNDCDVDKYLRELVPPWWHVL